MLVDGGPRRWRRRHAGWFAPGEARLVLLAGAAIVGGVGGFWAFAASVSSDVWVPALVFAGLLLISVPICVVVARQDSRLQRLLLLSLILKLLFVFVRYGVNETVYDGSADSHAYHAAAQNFYVNVHAEGRWSTEGVGGSSETQFLGYVAGVVSLVVGPTLLGGFLAFSWLAWIGLLCVFKAYRIAYPNAPPYLAAGLVLLLPSVLYWPSSIGKDAFMVLCIGLVTLGVARLLTPDRPVWGLVLVVPASYLMLQVRPHLLMIALVGGAASILARRGGQGRSRLSAVGRGLLLVALVPALFFGLDRMEDKFGEGPDEHGREQGFTVSGALARTEDQTTTGGSSFETRPISSPVDVPLSTITVLYRPFPFEVTSSTAMISAVEGTFLLVMTFAAGRWIWRMVPATRSHPFTAFCVAYVVAFIFAFANVGNAGILARQRVQMLPLLMVAVAAAREHHRVHVEVGESDPGSEDVPDEARDRPEPRELITT